MGTPPERLGLGGSVNYLTSAPSKSGKSKAHALGHSFGQAAATTSSTRRPAAEQVFTAGQNGAQTTTTAQNGAAPSKSGGKKPGSDAMFANPFDQSPTAAAAAAAQTTTSTAAYSRNLGRVWGTSG
ncbi:hypothetical protein ACP275_13G081500 [Erythranthe tilingii]